MSPDFGLFLGSINILRMQPIISARQMYHVYEEVVLQKKVNFKNFAEAQKHHWNLNPQGMIWPH